MMIRHPRLARTLLAPAVALALPLSLAGRAPAAPEHNPAQGAPHQDAPRPEQAERQRQRRAGDREKRSQNLRRVMSSLGFDDRALQDEVLHYISSEVRARAQVRRKAQEIYNALRDPAKGDDELRALLSQYQSVVQADRERRRLAEDALNDRIGFRVKPRLEAMLVLFGVIGDSPIALPTGQRSPR